MPKMSGGILMYRFDDGVLQVLLVHPGGPFNSKKDEGAWSIPKGEFEPGQDPLATAIREFNEELGSPVTGEFTPLGRVRQSGGKVVHAFAVEGDLDCETCRSNTFEMEWPPHSGTMQEFPEVDRADWFDLREAAIKLNPAQTAFLETLKGHIKNSAV